MRNLKKFLALVLAMMMVMSLMVTVNAASSYSDADKISDTYKTAVDVLTAVGVFQGDEGGFRPTDPIKRSEFAKVIYMINSGDTNAASASLDLYADACDFRDIAGSGEEWAKAFIGYASTYDLVKGSGKGGDFYPTQNITVVDVLTILLRTLGYGQGSELEGKLYQVNALRLAEDAGLLTNIPDGITTKNAERQVVAQLIYNVIQAPTVTGYNTTTGKYTVGGAPLAISTLKMVQEKTVADEWGNPIAGGWLYNGKTIASAPVELVGEFYNEVSECDIWDVKELDGDIVAYYVDGAKQNITDEDDLDTYNPVFSNGTSTHTTVLEDHPTYTTGGPGVKTVVYLVDGDYWIVQCHVWLAQVTKVNPARTDDNGHPIGITYDVNIYVDYDKDEDSVDTRNVTITAKGCPAEDETDEFVKGDYVLVHVALPNYDGAVLKGTKSNGLVTVAGIAPVAATGEIDDIYDNILTVDGEDFDESLNYYLNYEVEIEDATWTFFGDGMDNIIGQTQGSFSYAVIEKIEWKHHPDKVGNGYALADIMLADGTRKESVRIPAVADYASGQYGPTNNMGDDVGDVATGLVSDDYLSNIDGYYGHVFQYVEVSADTYYLKEVGDHAKTTAGRISNGNARIAMADGSFYTADDDTIFFIWDRNNFSYEVCVGIDELSATITNTYLCVYANENNYAKVAVVIKPTPSTASSGLYFIEEGTTVTEVGGKFYANLYPIGATKTQRVQISAAEVNQSTDPYTLKDVTGTGLYKINRSNGVMVNNDTGLQPITNGNFYNVTDGAGTSGQMPLTGVAVATNKFAGTFFANIKYDINSLQGMSDNAGETYADGATSGIDDGAQGMIVVNDSVKNGYTVDDTALEDFYDFRLNNAVVVKVNLEAVGTVLTGDFTLEAGSKEDITSNSLVLFVYNVNTAASNLEHDVEYAYVYKVVQVEGAAPAEAELTISHDPDVGGPNGKFLPKADGTYSFFVTVDKDEEIGLQFGNCNAEANLAERTGIQDRYEISVWNIRAGAYVHVYGDTTMKGGGVPPKAEEGDYGPGTDGGGELDVPALSEMYEDDLGITVDDDDPQNIVITIKSGTFNKASAAKQAQLAQGNFGGTTAGLVKGDKGYVGVTIHASSNIDDDSFYYNGKLYSDASTGTSENVYITVADWNGSRMVLRDGAVHTVRYTSNSKSFTVTITVVVR